MSGVSLWSNAGGDDDNSYDCVWFHDFWPSHTNMLNSALQRALESPAPSASLVFGDLITHIADLRTRAAGELGVAVVLHVDQHGEVCIQRYVLLRFDRRAPLPGGAFLTLLLQISQGNLR